jgi:uncharacterized protein involved in exopolysaccharide biosynthesis
VVELEAYVRRLREELRRRSLDEERLVAEVREHLVDRINEGMRRGLSLDAAAQEAFEQFGSPEAIAVSAAAERYEMSTRWGVLSVMWERKWWIVVPTVALASAAVFTSYYLVPVRYQSQAFFEITPMSPATAAGHARGHVQAMSEVLTSRTRLQQMIEELNLYERERRTSPIDAVVRQARRDVSIAMSDRPGIDTQTFEVRFVASDPRLAQRATARLASFIIDENVRQHEVRASGSVAFLDLQIAKLKQRLDADEDAMRFERGKLRHRTDDIEYEVLRDSYQELQKKRQESIIAAEFGRRQVGDQVRILDPPSLPESPLGPTRAQFGAIGGGGGFLLGLAFVAFSRRDGGAPSNRAASD